jgi:hypothetical protein
MRPLLLALLLPSLLACESAARPRVLEDVPTLTHICPQPQSALQAGAWVKVLDNDRTWPSGNAVAVCMFNE